MSPEIRQWQREHGVSDGAIAALARMLTHIVEFTPSTERPNARSEAAVQERERLAAAYCPQVMLWRNNNGAMQTDTGMVRFGLGNDSARMNKDMKSADLIGIYRHTVRQCDVGREIGVFLSDELKREDWKPHASDKRYAAQFNWAAHIETYGGIATIHNGCTGGGILDRIEAWKNAI